MTSFSHSLCLCKNAEDPYVMGLRRALSVWQGAPGSMMCGSFLLQRVLLPGRRNSERPGGTRRGLATPAGAPESTESPCQPKPAGPLGAPAARILPRLPLQVFSFGKNHPISFILKRPFTKRLILLKCTHKSRVSNLVFPLPVEFIRG